MIKSVESLSEIGDGLSGIRKANGVFLVLDLTAENVATLPGYFQENIYIVDSKGKAYSEDSSAESYYGSDSFLSPADKFETGIPKSFKLIFEVPADIQGNIAIKKTKISPDFEAFIPL